MIGFEVLYKNKLYILFGIHVVRVYFGRPASIRQFPFHTRFILHLQQHFNGISSRLLHERKVNVHSMRNFPIANATLLFQISICNLHWMFFAHLDNWIANQKTLLISKISCTKQFSLLKSSKSGWNYIIRLRMVHIYYGIQSDIGPYSRKL